jgi:hypothetical protein
MGKLSLAELEERVRSRVAFEDATKDLEWRDFEGLVSDVFSENGFKTFRNFRFSSKKRRYEVDVVALERPRIVVADCKHWRIRLGKASALKVAASAHLARAVEFGNKLQEFAEMGVGGWRSITIIPTLVTLYQERITENEGVLVVPIFKLNTFVEELRSGYFDSIKTKVITMDSFQDRSN